MNKYSGKIIIGMGLFVGSLSAMNVPRTPEWRCPEHTKTKTALATRAMIDLGISGAVAYAGIRDTQFMGYLFGDVNDASPVVVVAGGTAEQRMELMESQNSDAKCLKYLAASGILLCDAGSNVCKIRNYRDYIQQKHAAHHCLTDHKSN